MASIPSDHEVTETTDIADSNDSTQDHSFLQTLLNRSPSETDALTTTLGLPSTPAIAVPPGSTHEQRAPSSHSYTHSGQSTPSRHAHHAATSTVPTSPVPPRSPHIKASSSATQAAIKETNRPVVLTQPATLAPGEAAARPPSPSRSSVEAANGSDSSSDSRRSQPVMLWNVGGQFDSEMAGPRGRGRSRSPRRYHDVVVDQSPDEHEHESESVVLMRKFVRLQQMQTALMGIAVIVIIAVTLARL